jgi:hypothetical protein
MEIYLIGFPTRSRSNHKDNGNRPQTKRDQPLSTWLAGTGIPMKTSQTFQLEKTDPAGNVEDILSPSPNHPDKHTNQWCNVSKWLPMATAILLLRNPSQSLTALPVRWIRVSFDPKAWKRRKTDIGPISNVSDRASCVPNAAGTPKFLVSMHVFGGMVPSMAPEAQAFSAASMNSAGTIPVVMSRPAPTMQSGMNHLC